MPDKPLYSKSAADRAGRLHVELLSLPDKDALATWVVQHYTELIEADRVIDWWHGQHAHPLTMVNANLRHYLKPHENTRPTQRLKKRRTITSELVRFPKMKLSRMQDIGGLRVMSAGYSFGPPSNLCACTDGVVVGNAADQCDFRNHQGGRAGAIGRGGGSLVANPMARRWPARRQKRSPRSPKQCDCVRGKAITPRTLVGAVVGLPKQWRRRTWSQDDQRSRGRGSPKVDRGLRLRRSLVLSSQGAVRHHRWSPSEAGHVVSRATG
jgi:hypothetical protein